MDADDAGRAAVTALPEDVLVVFREFRTAEMSTLGREGLPLTWPVFPFFRPERGIFQVTTSIGLPQKAFNVRRNPRVAMLFSDPTGTGLLHPPAVLVQGDATCPDVIHTDVKRFEDDVRRGYRCQPKAKLYGADPISRRLVGWYFMRVIIDVVPRVIRWWPDGDFARTPCRVEVDHFA